jgi:hypothetical protein
VLAGGLIVSGNQETIAIGTSLAAPVSFPNGAVVKEVTARVFNDQSSDAFNVVVTLARQNLTNDVLQVLASLPPTSGPGNAILTTQSITNATVDNLNYAYYVKSQGGEGDGLRSVRIRYEVTTPLP